MCDCETLFFYSTKMAVVVNNIKIPTILKGLDAVIWKCFGKQRKMAKVVVRHNRVYSVKLLKRFASSTYVESINMDEKILYMLDLEVWRYEGDTKVTPRQVIEKKDENDVHYKAILDSDLSEPLVVFAQKNGNIDVLDGLHRLAKAYINRDTVILATFVGAVDLESCLHDPRNF
jgi:hypothetical protein